MLSGSAYVFTNLRGCQVVSYFRYKQFCWHFLVYFDLDWKTSEVNKKNQDIRNLYVMNEIIWILKNGRFLDQFFLNLTKHSEAVGHQKIWDFFFFFNLVAFSENTNSTWDRVSIFDIRNLQVQLLLTLARNFWLLFSLALVLSPSSRHQKVIKWHPFSSKMRIEDKMMSF